MKKKLIPLLLATALIIGACGNNATPADTGRTPADGGTTEAPAVGEHGVSEWGYNLSGVAGPTGLEFGGGTGQTDFSPITFTIYNEDLQQSVADSNFQGLVMQQMTADTGVTINYQWGIGDVSQQVTLMIADRSYPDLVFSRSNLGMFLEAEAFIDLAPLIEQYGPNIKALYGESFNSHKDEEGRIFFLGQNFVRVAPMDPENSFMLQHSVIEYLGFPEIRTLADFEDAIRTYKASHPEINGQPTIGMTLTTGEGWRWFITLGNPAGAATGVPNDGQSFVDPETLATSWRFLLPEHREYFRWLNGMHNEGLLDPDALTQTHDEYLQKIASGRVLGLSDANWQMQESEDILVANGMPERGFARLPVTIAEGVLHPNYRHEPYIATNGIGITDNATDPVRIIQFLDYLARLEIQVMSNWGFEGDHWEVIQGEYGPERVRTQYVIERELADGPAWTAEFGAGLMGYPWPNWGTGAVDQDGLPVTTQTEQVIIDRYTEPARRVLDAWGVNMWRDLFPTAEDLAAEGMIAPWGAVWHFADTVDPSSDLGQIQMRANDITAEFLMRSVTASPEEFDNVWDEFMNRLRDIDIERAGDLMTELVKEHAAWWFN